MQNKNPYYLHEENQLNPYNLNGHNRHQHNYQNTTEQFARENSNVNKTHSNHQTYNNGYQPPLYPPMQYPSYNQQPYVPYQSAQTYQQNPIPVYRQFDQSSQTSGREGFLDHCPYCNEVTRSIIQERLSKIGYFICCLLLCLTIVLFWLPFCFSCCHQKRVKCLKCKRTKFVIRNQCG